MHDSVNASRLEVTWYPVEYVSACAAEQVGITLMYTVCAEAREGADAGGASPP